MVEILIIDDEEMITKTLKRLLEKEGYEVIVSNSGIEAIESIKNKEFKLIIADIRMPAMDGIETIKSINNILNKDNGKNKPVIFITGYADEEAHRRAEELGYASYIYKPFDLKLFLEKVKESLKI